jgi:hypothetical protein
MVRVVIERHCAHRRREADFDAAHHAAQGEPSKVDRARAVAGLFEAGKVKIRMDAAWYGDLIQKFLSFPERSQRRHRGLRMHGPRYPPREHSTRANLADVLSPVGHVQSKESGAVERDAWDQLLRAPWVPQLLALLGADSEPHLKVGKPLV